MVQKPQAALIYIVICRFKIVSIPRIGNIPAALGKVEELVYLPVRIAASDTKDVSYIPTLINIYIEYSIKLRIIQYAYKRFLENPCMQ